jgi:hypothetical protein
MGIATHTMARIYKGQKKERQQEIKKIISTVRKQHL